VCFASTNDFGVFDAGNMLNGTGNTETDVQTLVSRYQNTSKRRLTTAAFSFALRNKTDATRLFN